MTGEITATTQFLGHKATVEDILVDTTSGRILSASVDGSLLSTGLGS